MLRRLLAAGIVLAALVAVIMVSWPQLFGLQRSFPVAQLVSLRGAVIAGAAVTLALLVFLALIARSARRLAGSLILVLLLAIAINGAVLGSRGFSSAEIDPDVAAASEDSLVVMAWNTLGDAPGAEAIAQLALDHGVDVLSLPETSAATAYEVADRMAEGGSPMQVLVVAYSPVLKAQSTALLVSTELGGYVAAEDDGPNTTLPSVVAVGAAGPPLVAVHAIAPLEERMGEWRTDLEWLSGLCEDPQTIMLGDFNSTVDHLAGLPNGRDSADTVLGGCRDAAVDAGSGAVGTWPSSAPALLGSPIDHIMVGDAWEVEAFEVVTSLDDRGSDHRPLLAVLSPREPASATG